MPDQIPPMSSGEFWTDFLHDMWANIRVARDLFVILVVWLFLSSLLLLISEGHGYLHALYSTWTTMATLGPLDGAPVFENGQTPFIDRCFRRNDTPWLYHLASHHVVVAQARWPAGYQLAPNPGNAQSRP